MKRLQPFLPCFFDLPLKEVLQILNVSHHTLDPIRRALGLNKWPFVDIVRGRFWNHEEVVALRAQMMPIADTEMQRILCRVATSAQQFWSAPAKQSVPANRQQPTTPSTGSPCQPPSTPEDESLPEGPVHTKEEEEDGSFWNDMRDLFGIANHGEALHADPRIEEHGLFFK